MIQLRYSRIEWTPDGCLTTFADGASWGGLPHRTEDYYEIADRCGLGDDVLAYARWHDFAHNFLWERLFDTPSYILFSLAHGVEPDRASALAEEALVAMFQKWLGTHERPILNDATDSIDWTALKAEALGLLLVKDGLGERV